ncbi:MAG: motility-associated protein, partial [Lysinibacillus sp.]
MDISSLIGIILAGVSLLVGMYFKGVGPGTLINPAAIFIIIFGTISAVVIAFPMKELKRVPKLFGKLFKETKLADDIEIIKMFSQWADLA